MLRIYTTRVFILTAGCWLLAIVSGTAQSTGPVVEVIEEVAAPPPPFPLPRSAADSARVRAEARSAQARFERIRRNHFSSTWSSSDGDCDEVVGRFCLWHGDDDDDWEPPPGDDDVREARAELIAALNRAAALVPGDGWVAGQRVRYLLEPGRGIDALEAARACRPAGDWWCNALAGFAHHSAGEWVRADSAFSAALDVMPPEERERWTDLSMLLGGGGWREYSRAPAAARDSLERRVWWLADPFWIVPGNDRRTEHFARLVMDRLQQDAETPTGISWGSDLRELLLRYGWWIGWERVRPRTLRLDRNSYTAHNTPRDRQFVPPVDFITNPHRIAPSAWPLEEESPRAGYTPPYASSVEPLEHQLALFRSGDSMIVVAAYELPDTAVAPDARVDAALILSPDELTAPAIARTPDGGSTAALSLTVADQPVLMSIEALVSGGGRAARARYGIHPPPIVPGVPGISDLLLLTDGGPLPESISEAVRRVRGSNKLRAGERVVIYWEVYGVDGDTEAMDVSLTLIDADPGWLRRLGEWIGVVRQLSPIGLSWREGASSEEPIARSLAIELPEMAPGLYTLELTVTLPGREPLVASREIEIVESVRSTSRSPVALTEPFERGDPTDPDSTPAQRLDPSRR